ncbi:GNAT family N-acetyltransferase [Maridesulfovibrio sp.]|uniref:GNAT family N-acetyltransferase n=1 Tax=Maridesulfovibrio sp. TaxID=2795000 RepID=UPI003BA8AF0D
MLTGEHTILRAIERNDLKQLMEWRNRPENRVYFREYRELSWDHQQNWYEKLVMNDPGTRMFAILDRSGRLLGACGLCYIDWVNRNADFSIYIGADDLYIDDVYAVDASKSLIKYGFEELNLVKVWAEIYAFDTKKTEMFTKLGFELEGRHKKTHFTNGEWTDSLFWGFFNDKT